MAKVKASGIVTIRRLLNEAGPEKLRACVARLSPVTQEVFQTAMTTDWITFPAEAEVFENAAAVLFTDDPWGLRKLGAAVAYIQFTGVYKVFLMVASVQFVVKRVASIWGTLYNGGQARVDDLTDHGGTLVASGMPDQLAIQREYICGFVIRLLEMTGVKDVHVTKVENDPNAWKWIFTWN